MYKRQSAFQAASALISEPPLPDGAVSTHYSLSLIHIFFYRLQAFFAAHDQLTQGQDEICLQGNRIILFRIIRIDVHRVDILCAGRADLNDLPLRCV